MSLNNKKRKPERPVSSNRRHAQATRTLKACELCRKQKTRCFKANEHANTCLRCTFLNKPCSFDTETSSPFPTASAPINGASSNDKLDMIYKGVNQILSLLSDNDTSKINSSDAKLLLEAASSMKNNYDDDTNVSLATIIDNDQQKIVTNPIDLENQSTFQTPTSSFKVSPFSMINNQFVSEKYVPRPIYNLMNLSSIQNNPIENFNKHDIINLNILSELETVNLMNDFRRNYGRWISFPTNLPSEILIQRLRTKSPLLLTTCCCLSLRYLLNIINPGDVNNVNRKRNTFNQLIRQLLIELNINLLKINSFKTFNGDIEFLQSLVILSIYSLSLTSIITSNNKFSLINLINDMTININDLNFDPWYLSGLGLTIFVSKTTIGNLLPNENMAYSAVTSPFTILYDEDLDSNEYQTLTIMRIYNHLVLVHLVNCVFSGRMAVVDEIRLNYCNMTLGLPSSTNFDGRMVSEISILLITYSYMQANLNVVDLLIEELVTNFANTKEEMRAWSEQWEYLFQQPALQFVELLYNFCSLVIYYCFNYKLFLIKSEQMEITDDLFNEDHIKYILTHSSDESIKSMFDYSDAVIKFIKLVDNDSYFAYLSDQVHFCFYFGGIFFINLAKYLQTSNKLFIIDNKIDFEAIKLLIEKFNKISQNNYNYEDISFKYKVGLQYCLKRHFPDI